MNSQLDFEEKVKKMLENSEGFMKLAVFSVKKFRQG